MAGLAASTTVRDRVCVLFIVQHKYFSLQHESSCAARAVSLQARHGATGMGCSGLLARRGRTRPLLPEMKEPPWIARPPRLPAHSSAGEGFKQRGCSSQARPLRDPPLACSGFKALSKFQAWRTAGVSQTAFPSSTAEERGIKQHSGHNRCS